MRGIKELRIQGVLRPIKGLQVKFWCVLRLPPFLVMGFFKMQSLLGGIPQLRPQAAHSGLRQHPQLWLH